MNPDSCPKPEALRSFVRCSLSEPEADSISEHLENCPACEETVVGFERNGDTISERIKLAAAQPTFAHEPECQRMLQSLLGEAAANPAAPECAGSDSPIAQSLRDYKIVAKLGEGGMGTVYKAIHQRLKKPVALKMLPTNRIGDQAAVARFEREMEVLGQLNHPHIVQALDAGEHERQHYLVMEYVEGCDLSDIIKRFSPLSIADACMLISQAAAGLQYAHEHGFVHRDIKPSNLMLMAGGGGGVVKILDLGLARALDQRPDAVAPHAELTTAGQMMGTLDYMAPEQGGDAHQVDIRADIYSLGATLYKLLTGESPYAEFAKLAPMQRLMAMVKNDPPPIRGKRADIPEKLAAIVHRMLAKQPEHRFATPADVVKALAPYCAGANLAALVVPAGVTQVLDKPSQPEPTTRAALQTTGRGRGRFLRTALIGFAAILPLAAIIVITTRNGTVEVNAPNGELPDDVKVVVTRGGDEIEVLQADNQWSAKIVNGEYDLELRSGQDRFELTDSKLTVSRLGRSVVTLQIRKSAKETNPAADTSQIGKVDETTKPDPSNPVAFPVKPLQTAIVEKPFTILRAGKKLRDFKSWSGVLGALETGDAIEVQGRGPYALPNPPFNNLNVTVRGAAGSRPELHFTGRNSHQGALRFDGVDLVLRHDDTSPGILDVYSVNPEPKVMFEIANSRVKAFSINAASASRMKCTDSVILLHGIVMPVEADFENNVVVFFSTSHCFDVSDGGRTMRLSNNTIVATQEHGGHATLLGFTDPYNPIPKQPVRVDARNNLFAMDGGPYFGQHIFPGDTPEKSAAIASWHGAGNLYCPYPQHGLATKDSDGKEVVEHPLDTWARKLNRSEREPGSQIAPWPQWKLAEAWWSEDVDYLATLRKQIEAVIPVEGIGPQWDLIGPGEAYVRALAAAGKPVAKTDLFPEALSGGPCVLVRNGQEVRGYRTLNDACSAAISDDVIELRTNHNVGDASLNEGKRLLTIRSGAGYSPEVGNLQVTQGNRAILEGLRFAPGATLNGYAQPPNPEFGQFIRIANCSFRSKGGHPFHEIGWFTVNHGTGDEKLPLLIQNCWSDGSLVLECRPDQCVRLENCVAPVVDVLPLRQEDKEAWHRIEFDRCALWSPEPRHGRGGLLWCIVTGARRLEVSAHRTVFESPTFMRQPRCQLRWQGKKNLFRLGHPDWFQPEDRPGPFDLISGLEDLRTVFKSDADSISAHPLAWQPEQWKLLPTSPGFESGPDKKDVGVDIGRLTKSLGL